MGNFPIFYPSQQLCSCAYPSSYQPYSLDDQLISAVRSGNLKRVRELLGQGADPNAKDKFGNTALHWVTSSFIEENPNAKDIALLLLSKGANPYATNREGRSALDWAIDQGVMEFADLIEDLKRNRAFWGERLRNPYVERGSQYEGMWG